MTFLELLEAIQTVSQTNVVGADVNELALMLDASGVSTSQQHVAAIEGTASGNYKINLKDTDNISIIKNC